MFGFAAKDVGRIYWRDHCNGILGSVIGAYERELSLGASESQHRVYGERPHKLDWLSEQLSNLRRAFLRNRWSHKIEA